MNIQGLKRPTATGSDITSDKNHGADSNITLIAEQIGRSPATEQNISLDVALPEMPTSTRRELYSL